MTEASGPKNKQEISKINNSPNLIKNEVMDALTGVPLIENNCHTMVDVSDWKMFVEIVDAMTFDIMRRGEAKKVKVYTKEAN